MSYVIAAVCGAVWGAAAAFLNFFISKRGVAKNNTASLLGANAARMVVDIAALGLVFLLRNVLPFPFEVTLIATAISMSLVTIVCAYRLSGQMKPRDDGEKK